MRLLEILERHHVALGQILDMQVIANARAIGRGPVVAVDRKLREFPGRDPAQERHEVVRASSRRLTEHAGRVRPRRIEIAQDRDPPVRVGAAQVAQEILDDALRPAIDVVRAQRRILRNGQVVGLAVHRGGRTEHERGHTRLAHDLRQRECAADVDVIVGQGPRLGLANGLQPGAVNHRSDRMVVECRAQLRDVAHVRGHAWHRPPGKRLQPRQHRRRAVGEIVEYNWRIAGLRKFDDHVRANVTRAAGDENGVCHIIAMLHDAPRCRE